MTCDYLLRLIKVDPLDLIYQDEFWFQLYESGLMHLSLSISLNEADEISSKIKIFARGMRLYPPMPSSYRLWPPRRDGT